MATKLRSKLAAMRAIRKQINDGARSVKEIKEGMVRDGFDVTTIMEWLTKLAPFIKMLLEFFKKTD